MMTFAGGRPRMTASLLVMVSLLLAAACTAQGSSAGHPPAVIDASVPLSAGSGRQNAPARIAMIVLENKEYAGVIGSPQAPYLNALASRSVLLTGAFAVSHPSLPNYLSLTGGSSFGVTSDCISCMFTGPNIVDQLVAHHMTWNAYMQGLPAPCFTGAQAGSYPHLYAAKHDPFIHYTDIRSSSARCHRIVPFSRLGADLGRNGLPRFSFISPDECLDMHSCPVSAGDHWLSTWVPRILGGLGPKGLLIVLFDEGTSHAGCCGPRIDGGHVAALVTGPGARHGVRIAGALDHYSILRLIEDTWGFPRLRHAAYPSTPTIWGWRRGP